MGRARIVLLVRAQSVRRRAFTLIELMVVMLIIATLMSILLPSLAKSRKTAQATVGAANLRSLAGVMLAYTNENREAYLTPFGKDRPNPSGAGWADVVNSSDNSIYWRFLSGDRRYHTDFFGYYWYSYMADAEGRTHFREEQLSPADGPLKGEMQSNQTLIREPKALWPSSFIYSPTFWSSPDRFTGTRQAMTPDLLSTITTSQVSQPAAKVMMWVRADFTKNDPDGAPLPYNAPSANTWVATADGACEQVNMLHLTQRAAQATDSHLVPCNLLIPPAKLTVIGPPDQPFQETGIIPPDGGYPLFFWTTRNGVQGRDLVR
jgi:prepilin-type N-terminal cleavage/methylation domain-containing protein